MIKRKFYHINLSFYLWGKVLWLYDLKDLFKTLLNSKFVNFEFFYPLILKVGLKVLGRSHFLPGPC